MYLILVVLMYQIALSDSNTFIPRKIKYTLVHFTILSRNVLADWQQMMPSKGQKKDISIIKWVQFPWFPHRLENLEKWANLHKIHALEKSETFGQFFCNFNLGQFLF